MNGLDSDGVAGERCGAMICFTSDKPLEWGALDVPLVAMPNDWHGRPVDPAPGYAVACDAFHFWFIAHHRGPAHTDPASRPGLFKPGLWQYDVAELFLADPGRGRYLEFNLAPNAAWWNCEFTAPRQRVDAQEIAMPDVHTWSDLSADGAWVAAMAVPLEILRARIGFGAGTTANACMILGSQEQRFLTATPLGGGEPDFHRPERFSIMRKVPIDALGAPPQVD